MMGETFLQSVMGGIAGIAAGYLISYLLGYLSIPVSTPWELNLTPAFAKMTETSAKTIRLPVNFSAALRQRWRWPCLFWREDWRVISWAGACLK
jgi:hypothetical protein